MPAAYSEPAASASSNSMSIFRQAERHGQNDADDYQAHSYVKQNGCAYQKLPFRWPERNPNRRQERPAKGDRDEPRGESNQQPTAGRSPGPDDQGFPSGRGALRQHAQHESDSHHQASHKTTPGLIVSAEQ